MKALASGIDGIENETQPPEMFRGDVYAAQNLPAVPGTLASAIPPFATSGFVTEVLSRGVRDHYAHFYSTEVAAYDAAVTDWERARYFDRI
jgi:glutamine synthetase